MSLSGIDIRLAEMVDRLASVSSALRASRETCSALRAELIELKGRCLTTGCPQHRGHPGACVVQAGPQDPPHAGPIHAAPIPAVLFIAPPPTEET